MVPKAVDNKMQNHNHTVAESNHSGNQQLKASDKAVFVDQVVYVAQSFRH